MTARERRLFADRLARIAYKLAEQPVTRGAQKRQRKMVERAQMALARLATTDTTAGAKPLQAELLPLVHRSMHTAGRLICRPDQHRDIYHRAVNAERVYLAHWLRLNKGRPPFLGLLMSPNPARYAVEVTQRDAEVAATVVQWLGTNVGSGFVHQAERSIEAQKRRIERAGKPESMRGITIRRHE